MNDRTGNEQDPDGQDVGNLRAALDAHRRAYRRLVHHRPLMHQARTGQSRSPLLVALLAAGLATVAFAILWPSNEPVEPTPLAGGRPPAPLTLRPDPVNLSGLTKRTPLHPPRHGRITQVRFRPPRRPAPREG